MELFLEILRIFGFIAAGLVLLPIVMVPIVWAMSYLERERVWDTKLTKVPVKVENLTFRQAREFTEALQMMGDLQYAVNELTAKRDNPERLPAGDFVEAPRPTSAYNISDDELVQLPGGGTMRFGDIPKDPKTGLITDAWLAENCPCGEHGGKTTEVPADTSNVGLYL